MGSIAKHRAEPEAKADAGKAFRPMLFMIGGLIALTGVVAGGAGILGVLQL